MSDNQVPVGDLANISLDSGDPQRLSRQSSNGSLSGSVFAGEVGSDGAPGGHHLQTAGPGVATEGSQRIPAGSEGFTDPDAPESGFSDSQNSSAKPVTLSGATGTLTSKASKIGSYAEEREVPEYNQQVKSTREQLLAHFENIVTAIVKADQAKRARAIVENDPAADMAEWDSNSYKNAVRSAVGLPLANILRSATKTLGLGGTSLRPAHSLDFNSLIKGPKDFLKQQCPPNPGKFLFFFCKLNDMVRQTIREALQSGHKEKLVDGLNGEGTESAQIWVQALVEDWQVFAYHNREDLPACPGPADSPGS